MEKSEKSEVGRSLMSEKGNDPLKQNSVSIVEPIPLTNDVPWFHYRTKRVQGELTEIHAVREDVEYDYSHEILETLIDWLNYEIESENARSFEQRGKTLTEVLSKIAYMREYKIERNKVE
jgi:hypothetical protein